MKNIYRVFLSISMFLLVSFGLLVNEGFCVGEIEHVFIPGETYPTTLKDMHLQTRIVENSVPKAIIVVNTDDPLYLGFANSINTSIHSLPGLSGVSLGIVDDDVFLANPQFNNSIILIGNYVTNKVIKQYVYEKDRQRVDINRPGANNWVINNLRIGKQIGDAYYLASAIVIGSQSATQLQVALNLFKNEMLSAAYQNNSIIFDESVNGKHGTRWSITPVYEPPDPTLPSTTSTNIGNATGYANRYWLTGDKNDIEYFVKIINNYGLKAEDPTLFDNISPDFNADPPIGVGDNSGAIDFHMKNLIIAWMNVERSPYFSDAALPSHITLGGQTIEMKLYLTKLFNWMIREYYKCGNVRGLISGGPGNPQVRGAIGYAERDSYPLGNHELGAGFGLYLTGQYFTRDGYSYDETNVQGPPYYYYFDPTYPDDHAAQWVLDGDIAFVPYLQLSWVNDDAGGYYQSDTSMTRDYLRFKDDPALSEAYFGNSGGSLGIGMDRSVADTFGIVTPNSLMMPGFGDVHEFTEIRSDWNGYELRQWRERYLDGRYSWMCDELFNIGTLGWDDWGKSFLQYGLINLQELGIQNEKPVDLVGIKIVPLQQNLFNVANNMGGQWTYGNSIYSEPIKEAHVFPGEAINKVIFRNGWGNGFDQEDQYIGIDCVSYLGHGHEDALGIFAIEDNDAIFLIDNTYYSEARGYQNAVTVKKDGQNAVSYSSTVAKVDDVADFADTGFVHLELPYYGNYLQWSGWNGQTVVQPVTGEWSVNLHRTVFWQKEGLLLVLDQAQANDAGSYELNLRWKPNNTSAYSYSLNDDTINIVKTAGEKHCTLKTLGGNYAIDPTYGNARTTSNYTLGVGNTASIPTLIYTYNGTDNPNYQISAINSDTIYHVTSSVTNEDIYIGKVLNTQTKTFGNYTVKSNLFYIDVGATVPDYFALVNGYSLSQQNPSTQLFLSNAPVSVECDIANLEGKIIVDGASATINNLYIPAGYQLQVDGQITTVPFTLTQGAHEFMYVNGGPVNPTLSIDDVSVLEGSSGTTQATFHVTLNGQHQTVTVQYATADGSATVANNDYIAVSNTLSFSSSETQKTVTIQVVGDTAVEPNEDFYVNLSNPTGGATISDNQGVGTIVNDDNTTLPSISINDVSVTEGNSGTTTANFTVTLSQQNSQAVTVHYSTANNTATAGSDYVAIADTLLTFSPNQTSKPINVTINGDTEVESNETFFVNLSNANGATISDQQGIGTILNDDTATPGNNVALNKPYTVSTPANGEYPDEGGITLTNGLYAGTTAIHNSNWASWNNLSFWVNIDLQDIHTINGVNISSLIGGQWGISAVNSIQVQVSNDGALFNPVSTIIGPTYQGTLQLFDYIGEFDAVEVRFVRLTFTRASGGFTHIDEIEVIGNQPPVIEPIPEITVPVGQTAVVNVSATDPESDPITLNVTPLLARATFIDNGDGTGIFTCQTGPAMAGNSYEFTLTASDGVNTSTAPILINVIRRGKTEVILPRGNAK